MRIRTSAERSTVERTVPRWKVKRATGGKSRAEMTLAELEAAVEWLGRNRLRDHLQLLDGDTRFGWRAAKGRVDAARGATAGEASSYGIA